MDVGDEVTLFNESSVRGVIAQLPRSEGRKRPRALVSFEGGQRWVHVDELTKAEPLEGAK